MIDPGVDATRPSTSSPALEVVGLSSGYGSATVLRDVNLTVPVGSITALLGPNGAGKTTFLRTVSGFLPAKSGTVRLAGEDVTKLKSHKRFASGLCHIPEGRGVFRSLTVRENIVTQSARGNEKESIERATQAFPVLGRRIDQNAGTMSGGEQQMLAMAAAYVRDPKLVLVDEASLGLAPLIVDQIFAFLEGIASTGASLLIVDQYVHRALKMATHAFILHRGTIVFDGEPGQLLDSNLFEQYLGRGTG